jgi:hypothetical protein
MRGKMFSTAARWNVPNALKVGLAKARLPVMVRDVRVRRPIHRRTREVADSISHCWRRPIQRRGPLKGLAVEQAKNEGSPSALRNAVVGGIQDCTVHYVAKRFGVL